MRVDVRRDDLLRGRFPPVCVVTGRRADGLFVIRWSAHRGPQSRLVELLIGLPGFGLLTASTPRELEAQVPLASGVVERWARRRTLAPLVAMLATAPSFLAFASFAKGDWPQGPLAAVVIFGGFGLALLAGVDAARGPFDIYPTSDEVAVLTKAHPEFVRAYRAAGASGVDGMAPTSGDGSG